MHARQPPHALHPRIPAFEAIYTVCHSVQPGRGCHAASLRGGAGFVGCLFRCPRARPLPTAVGGTIRGPPLVYLSPTPPTYENEGSRGMVMPSHQKVRAAHGIDAWPSHVRQHVGSNRNNTSGSAQCLRRDSVNQSNGARAGCTWSHAQHLRRLCRGIQKRLFSRCSLALTATPPELLIMLAVFASIPVPQRFFCSALKIDGPTRHGPRR